MQTSSSVFVTREKWKCSLSLKRAFKEKKRRKIVLRASKLWLSHKTHELPFIDLSFSFFFFIHLFYLSFFLFFLFLSFFLKDHLWDQIRNNFVEQFSNRPLHIIISRKSTIYDKNRTTRLINSISWKKFSFFFLYQWISLLDVAIASN